MRKAGNEDTEMKTMMLSEDMVFINGSKWQITPPVLDNIGTDGEVAFYSTATRSDDDGDEIQIVIFWHTETGDWEDVNEHDFHVRYSDQIHTAWPWHTRIFWQKRAENYAERLKLSGGRNQRLIYKEQHAKYVLENGYVAFEIWSKAYLSDLGILEAREQMEKVALV